MKFDDDIEKAKIHYSRGLAGDGHVVIDEYGEEGARNYFETHYNPIYNDNNEIIGVSAFAQNVTERIKAVDNLEKTSQENQALFNELQHRAKNSFHLLSNMTDLMEKVGMSDETKSVLSEIKSRINAVSEIYDLLYETSSIIDVRLDHYLSRINLNMSWSLINMTISEKFEEVTVSVRKAIPIGLIVVELVTNSIKYAFPKNKKGKISLSLKKKNKVVIIKISDNGVGLPEGFDIAAVESMGLRLVNILVKQIDGSLKIVSKNGTKCQIEFMIY